MAGARVFLGVPGLAQDNTAMAPPLGFVDVSTAIVAGTLEVSGGRAVVRGGGVITARDRTAELLLNRGGAVNVCATSSLHVTAGTNVMGVPPLLLALDRGAMEVRLQSTAHDVIITPDLRFTVESAGPLDLRLRVTTNGDTCVEHRGLQAPPLEIIDQFGEGRYELRAGQHVLFEHGSLREVVDHESSPCGCPAAPVVSMASRGESSTAAAAPGAAVVQSQNAVPPPAAVQHPFPAAESQGLAPENRATAVPQAPPGEPHAQVDATMAYRAPGDANEAGAAAAAAPAPAPAVAGTGRTDPGSAAVAAGRGDSGAGAAPARLPESGTVASGEKTTVPVRAEAPPPPPAPTGGDLAHSIGRFFRRLFGRR